VVIDGSINTQPGDTDVEQLLLHTFCHFNRALRHKNVFDIFFLMGWSILGHPIFNQPQIEECASDSYWLCDIDCSMVVVNLQLWQLLAIAGYFYGIIMDYTLLVLISGISGHNCRVDHPKTDWLSQELCAAKHCRTMANPKYLAGNCWPLICPVARKNWT
jgi:hypothetical protein